VKTVVLAVTNDLVNDQRVLRVISTLQKSGSRIVFIGRRLKSSRGINAQGYKPVRFRLLFNRKLLFYAEYNIRLFLYLLFSKADVMVANDLDTLPAVYLASRVKSKPVIYDAHEYFTGSFEMRDSPFVRRFWERIEKRILPRLQYFMTVNDSIAGLYKEKYGIDAVVVRNFARYRKSFPNTLKLPRFLQDRKYFIIQGTGLNRGRGVEEAVLAMKQMEDCLLVIVGRGLALEYTKKMIQDNNLQEKVILLETLPYEELMIITSSAAAGLSLDKPLGENYLYSLPNKISDYIMAGIPIIAGDLPEVASIIRKYETGIVCKSIEPDSIAQCMNRLLNEDCLSKKLKENTEKAAMELCWEMEEERVIALYKEAGIQFE